MHCLSGENTTELKKVMCPVNGPATTHPVAASHTRIMWSLEADQNPRDHQRCMSSQRNQRIDEALSIDSLISLQTQPKADP
jgi:hypothetical protein